MDTLLDTLIKRDGMTKAQAMGEIHDARVALMEAIDSGEDASDFMMDWFGLELDYLEELIL